MNKCVTNITTGPQTQPFFNEVAKILVQQPDYKGMGGHGLENHGGHAMHSQTSIGMANRTINIRTPK